MTRKELRRLMPKDGKDLSGAMQIIDLGYPSVEPVMPDMVRWMRIGESPVADAFETLGRIAGDKQTWGFNLCRNRKAGDFKFSCSLAQTGGAFHTPSRFAKLLFNRVGVDRDGVETELNREYQVWLLDAVREKQNRLASIRKDVRRLMGEIAEPGKTAGELDALYRRYDTLNQTWQAGPQALEIGAIYYRELTALLREAKKAHNAFRFRVLFSGN